MSTRRACRPKPPLPSNVCSSTIAVGNAWRGDGVVALVRSVHSRNAAGRSDIAAGAVGDSVARTSLTTLASSTFRACTGRRRSARTSSTRVGYSSRACSWLTSIARSSGLPLSRSSCARTVVGTSPISFLAVRTGLCASSTSSRRTVVRALPDRRFGHGGHHRIPLIGHEIKRSR